MKKNIKQNKGITLIALVITIIVLLIVVILICIVNANGNKFIDKRKIESQLQQVFYKKFKIIDTEYISVEELNKNKPGPIADVDEPYYSFIAYNEEDEMCIAAWTYGNPNNDINNYMRMPISNLEEYKLTQKIINKIPNKKKSYLYVLEDISFREGYNGVEDSSNGNSYWWRFWVIEKSNLSHRDYIEGYVDSNFNIKILSEY